MAKRASSKWAGLLALAALAPWGIGIAYLATRFASKGARALLVRPPTTAFGPAVTPAPNTRPPTLADLARRGASPPAAPPEGQPAPQGTPPPTSGSVRQHAVDVLNQYRRRAGVPPLALGSPALQAYADAGARFDARAGGPHRHFALDMGGGVAAGENEAPGWSLSLHGGSLEQLVEDATAAMFAEGPRGGHYQNIVRPTFTSVGIGIFQQGDLVWLVQDFR